MPRRLTLRTKFALMAAMTCLLIATLAGMSLLSTQRLNDALARVATDGRALGNFLLGDMMHDALKADVLTALLVAGGETVAEEQTVRDDLAEHATVFRTTMTDNRALHLSPEIDAAMLRVAPALEAYIAEATAIVELAFRDRPAAFARVPGFVQAFDRLAEDNESVGGLIEQAVVDGQASAAAASETANLVVLGTAIATLLLFAGVALATVRSIEAPLRQCVDCLGRIEAGDLDSTVDYRANDEIGRVAEAVEHYRQAAIRLRKLQIDAEEQRQAAEASKVKALVTMADNVEDATTQAVAEVVSKAVAMADAARRMSGTAGRVDGSATAVSAASTQALSNAEAVAVASEQLTASIREIAQQVTRSTTIASSATARTAETLGIVSTMSESAKRVGEVVNIINAIASQTNLLALNATIEASRAGDAGKGFAVVAAEVKNLAQQTQLSTLTIADQVKQMQEVTDRTVEAITAIAAIIEEIDGLSTAVASAVEEQSAATDEIARNIQQSTEGSREVARHISEVSREAGGVGDLSREVLSVSERLSTDVAELKATIVRLVRTSTTEVDRRRRDLPVKHDRRASPRVV